MSDLKKGDLVASLDGHLGVVVKVGLHAPAPLPTENPCNEIIAPSGDVLIYWQHYGKKRWYWQSKLRKIS